MFITVTFAVSYFFKKFRWCSDKVEWLSSHPHGHCDTCVESNSAACLKLRSTSLLYLGIFSYGNSRGRSQSYSCPVIECPLNCGIQGYHECKETEHKLLCANAEVPCINDSYGCPATMKRHKLGPHLSRCPASVVVCRKQWRRRNIPLWAVKSDDQDSPSFEKTLTNRDENILAGLTNNQRQPRVSTWAKRKTLPSFVTECPLEETLGISLEIPICLLAKELMNESKISHRENLETKIQSVYEKMNPEIEIGTKEYIFTCGKEFRRDEIENHLVNNHDQIHNELDGLLYRKCPNRSVGCRFSTPRMLPIDENHLISYNVRADAFCVTQNEITVVTPMSQQPRDENSNISDIDRLILNLDKILALGSQLSKSVSLSDLPDSVLCRLTGFLDPLSIQCLSLTNKRMRNVCKSVVEKRGIVVLTWEKISDNPARWKNVKKKWLYSTAFSTISSWTITDLSLMEAHLKDCPYGYKRVGSNCRICCKDFNSNVNATLCAHMTNCRHCGCKILQWKQDDHEALCPSVKISCLNRQHACREIMDRKDQNEHLKNCSSMCINRYRDESPFNLVGIKDSKEKKKMLHRVFP